ncbi:D-psicose/D-tagatose/L-ribulose 3-epimerase [Rhodobium orientis]|uniref:Epimerase n=1 Tax=Rhodobium orientis TaxID=34017 RepID=A0A327JQ68_9HYPH|nr:sugar phosphate isomerase/epimerase family protein [Rhodobium orientis]MBB4302492.1 D-psicose/D-tagatose/L-ribulose 3-epimerase [Rhodobium orientis]MBK5949341.1 epimerase [Rhodobium orientis]RAI28610.1 epimerase [Rhodobium orientis]
MNKLGVHALVWTGGWSHDEAARAIGSSAELGFDIIEIPALDPRGIDIEFTAKKLEENGIGTTISLGLDASTDVSSTDKTIVARGEERLNDALNVAIGIGATHMCGILYSAFQKYMEPPTETGIANSVEVLQRICETAAKHDITIGLEVVNRYESNVINTAEQAVAMCRRIGAPNVKVHLDTYHMNIEEADNARAIRETGDDLGYFHIGESHRGYLGSGNVDFTKMFRALAEIDYQHPITFESFSSVVTGQPLTGILGIWRNLWDDGADLCRHAQEYIRTEMKSAKENVAGRGTAAV